MKIEDVFNEGEYVSVAGSQKEKVSRVLLNVTASPVSVKQHTASTIVCVHRVPLVRRRHRRVFSRACEWPVKWATPE